MEYAGSRSIALNGRHKSPEGNRCPDNQHKAEEQRQSQRYGYPPSLAFVQCVVEARAEDRTRFE